MQKNKKRVENQKFPQVVATAPYPDSDIFLDNLVRVVGNFGFQQILLPALESRQNFSKSQTLTRMYKDNLLALPGLPGEDMIFPPTKTPAVIGRYLSNRKSIGAHVSKWFHLSPVLRLAGDKYTPVHELGLYVLGEDSAMASAQLINATAEIFRTLGCAEFVIQLNSLGCGTCQSNYQDLLSSHFAKSSSSLCSDCEADFEKNPLVVWNCVNGICQEMTEPLPPIIDSLDEPCKTDLMGVLENIDELNIPYTLNPAFVPKFLRHHVVFQIVAADGGGTPIGYGGNFSALALEMSDAPGAPMLGMLTTFEKLMSVVPEERRRTGPKVEVFMVPLGAVAARKALVLHRDLQHSGILSAEAILASPSIKNQLKVAAEKKCEIALIIGQKEAIDETVILRDMRSGMQEIFSADRIIEEVKKRLGK